MCFLHARWCNEFGLDASIWSQAKAEESWYAPPCNPAGSCVQIHRISIHICGLNRSISILLLEVMQSLD